MNDKGPWWVAVEPLTGKLIGVQSDDFNHDVLLRVTGDFESEEQKVEYAKALKEKLNQS